MEQKNIALKQDVLQSKYELNRLEKSIHLDREEYKMGIKSKAQLEVAEEEYNLKLEKTKLQLESLKKDSITAIIKNDLLKTDMDRENKKRTRVRERLKYLVITAPISGQLSMLNATPGQSISSGSAIAEIKVLDKYKIRTSINEYYIDKKIGRAHV